jgi:N-acetylglucosaminyldiphosphoundecaprenol N-acetyl-beta-D-mannosaminyltransferase
MSTKPANALALPGPFMESVVFLGARIDLVTSDSLLDLVYEYITARRRVVIAHHNLHSLCLQSDPRCETSFRRFYDDVEHTVADGMSVVLLGKLHGKKISRRNRVPLNDWLPVLLPVAVRNRWRIFYLGSTPDAAVKGAEVLRTRFPGLQLKAHHGHFDARYDSDSTREVLAEISRYRPHILFVGMGMPRQELWLGENCHRIEANVIFTSGATMDYIAGEKRMAPRWMGTLGLEWAFRLATEPKRLAHRYLVEPWGLVSTIVTSQLVSRWSISPIEPD